MTTTETPDSRRRYLFATALTAIALTLYACGSVSDPNAGDPDAGSFGGGDGGLVGPEIISTSPADGAARVSVLSDVRVDVSTSLDPATIDGSSVVLRDMAGQVTIRGDVAYDDGAKQIVFTPALPLAWGATYELSLSSIADPSGIPLADATVSFVTYRNPITRVTNYSRTSINYYWDYEHDADGRTTRILSYQEPGPDDMWMTADDVLASHTDYEYAGDTYVATVAYDGPGLDQQWLTGDDEVSSYSENDWTARGARDRIRSYNSPGPDGQWRTSDDVPFLVTGYDYNGDGHMVEMTRSSDPGTDGMWLTDDDSYDFRWQWDIDDDGKQTHWYAYDAVDAITSHRSYTYDSDGALLGYVYYNHPGADQIWLTGDDGVQSHYAYALNQDRLSERFIYYTGTGPDEDWLTSDDTVQSYSATAYDSAGNRVSASWYDDAGTDEQWFTGDDTRYVANDYDTSL